MKFLKQYVLVLWMLLFVGSAFSAQDPAVLLEKGIYTEETLGNLNDAIGIYRQVLTAAESTRRTLATAQFRIGMCYWKTGRTADARAAFSDLEKLYPEQKALISGIPDSGSGQSGPRRVPWVDGEELQFVDGDDDPIATYRLESAQVKGKAGWNLQALFLRRGYSFYKVSMDISSLLPVSSVTFQRTRDSRGRPGSTRITTIDYTPGVMEVSRGTIDGEVPSDKKRLLAFDREAYDFHQLDMIIRTLPLREGLQTSIPVINPSWVQSTSENASQVNNFKIFVPVREKITVPAGSFECFKVVQSWSSGSATVYWISTDDHAYIVKIEGLDGVRKLKSIGRIERDHPVIFEDREFKVTAPSQWFIRRYATQPEIVIVKPDMGTEVTLTVSGNQTTTLEIAVDKAIESAKDAGRYDVRPESRASISISGLPAIRYIADIQSGFSLGQNVEYAFYFAKSNKIYKLYFQVSPEAFDSVKDSIDSIASSLVVK